MFAFYNSLKGFVILFMAFVGIVFTGCQRNELLTLTFDYAAFSTGDLTKFVEKTNPATTLQMHQFSSIEERRKSAKGDKEWAKKVIEENKKNVPSEIYQEALLEYNQIDIKVASMGGPFEIKISETKDVPLLGDWETINVNGGVFELSGRITAVKDKEDFLLYYFDQDEHKLNLVMHKNFKKYPIVIILDHMSHSAILYGNDPNYLDTALEFINLMASKVKD
ncbi:MAG: hypothetical protein J5977_04085 [Fibrobacter sp.]|nr:hypothetical protein [Fibrobacter sp.]